MAGGRLGAALLGLLFCWAARALDVSVGKATSISAQNGTDVLLPCTFTACIGFENALFSWWFNATQVAVHGEGEQQERPAGLRGLQPAGGAAGGDPQQGQPGIQPLHPPPVRRLQRLRAVHVRRQEPQGEGGRAQRHHHPGRRGGAGEGGQDAGQDHRGGGGGCHRAARPHPAAQEAHPIPSQEEEGEEQRVPGELLWERQHGERAGWFQSRPETCPQGLRRGKGRPGWEPPGARPRGGERKADLYPQRLMLETRLSNTAACNLLLLPPPPLRR